MTKEQQAVAARIQDLSPEQIEVLVRMQEAEAKKTAKAIEQAEANLRKKYGDRLTDEEIASLRRAPEGRKFGIDMTCRNPSCGKTHFRRTSDLHNGMFGYCCKCNREAAKEAKKTVASLGRISPEELALILEARASSQED